MTLLQLLTYRFDSDENEENWIPDHKEACADAEVSEEQLRDHDYDPEYYETEEERAEAMLEAKWQAVRKPRLHPVPFNDVSYIPQLGKRLADRYRDSGLQIIVKMASIELTPEPTLEGGCRECRSRSAPSSPMPWTRSSLAKP